MEKDEGRAATGRDSEKYILRFPPGMRERLHEAARANNRSLNAELVARLQTSFERVHAAGTEIEAAAYRSHALALESQAMTLQNQMLELMDRKTKAGSAEGEGMHVLRRQIDRVQDKLLELDAMTRELHEKAKRPPTQFEEAGGRNRTGTGLTPGDFESPAPPKVIIQTALRPDGTFALLGDPEAIKAKLKAAGFTKFVPMKGGMLVGVTEADAARGMFGTPPNENELKARLAEVDRESRRLQQLIAAHHGGEGGGTAVENLRGLEGEALFARDEKGRLVNAPGTQDVIELELGRAPPAPKRRTNAGRKGGKS